MDPLVSTSGTAPIPVHVAIIMDGNGRWAKQRNLPRTVGHKHGAEAVRRTVRAAAELGIGYLTLFGFSSENWSRPEREIEDLMGLLRLYLRSETAELHKNNVRIRIIGDRTRLARDIVQLIEQAESTTAGNTGLTAVLALSYGGRQDITHAAQALARALAVGQPTTRRLQRVVIDAGEQAWQISTGVDKALPTATGNAVRSGPVDRAEREHVALVLSRYFRPRTDRRQRRPAGAGGPGGSA